MRADVKARKGRGYKVVISNTDSERQDVKLQDRARESVLA
jgi:hypothetical protein